MSALASLLLLLWLRLRRTERRPEPAASLRYLPLTVETLAWYVRQSCVFLQSQDMLTLPVVLSQYVSFYRNDHGVFLAGTLLAIVPPAVLFLALEKECVGGLTTEAVKGRGRGATLNPFRSWNLSPATLGGLSRGRRGLRATLRGLP